MHAIDVDFENRAALREALLDTFSEGGIFIEGNYDVTSGSPKRMKSRATSSSGEDDRRE